MLLRRFNRLVRHIDLRCSYFLADFSLRISQKQMKDDREKAVYAYYVIETITKAQNSNHQDIFKPSLRDSLLDLRINSPHFTCAQENRLAVLDIFKTGVILNQNVFRQGRIVSAKQASKYFVFCPNLLTTKPIFESIRNKQICVMIHGGYGISKTVAMILFHYLSSIVNKYIYRAFSDQKQKNILQELRQHKLIQDVPKIFYWSINRMQDQNQQIQQLILSLRLQSTEIFQNQKVILQDLYNSFSNYDVKSLKQFIRKLKKFYQKKKVPIKVAIDQVNVVTSAMKQWNNFYIPYIKQKSENQEKLWSLLNQPQRYQYNKKSIDQLIQQKKQAKILFQQNKNQIMDVAKKMMQFIYSLKILSQKIIYNTSINIQKNLIQIQKVGDARILSFNFQTLGHKDIEYIKIKFSQEFNNQWAISDFYHYFWFQVEKRLQAKGFSDKLPIFKIEFYRLAKAKEYEQRLPKYVRFLNIRQMFQSNPQLMNFSVHSSDQTVLIYLDKIIRYLSFYARNQCVTKIISFIQKGLADDVKIKQQFIYLLFYLASKTQKTKINSPMQFTIRQLQNYFQNISVRKYLLSSNYNREFLPVQFTQDNTQSLTKVNFQWTAAQFISIGFQAIFKYLGYENRVNLTKEELCAYFLHLTNKAGYIFQHHLIEVLKCPRTVAEYEINKERKYFQNFQTLQFLSFKQFKKDKKLQLKQQNNKRKSQNVIKKQYRDKIWINLHPVLILAKQNPGKYFFASPQEFKEQWKHCQNNPSVDYAIVLYNILTDKFQIQFFDVTITLDKLKISQKIEKAQILLPQIVTGQPDQDQFTNEESIRYQLNNPINNFQVTHVILCYQQMVRQSFCLKDMPHVKIGFCSIENLKINKCESIIAREAYQLMRFLCLRFQLVKDKFGSIFFNKKKR